MRFEVALAAMVGVAGCLDPNDKFMPATETEPGPPPPDSTSEPPPPTSEGPGPGPGSGDMTTVVSTTTTPDTDTGPVCGDGVVEGGEECDDGDDDDTDECTGACKLAGCGDGVVWAGEEACDDGNGDDSDVCLSDCEFATCGDGVVHAGKEACDDGNLDDSDECTSDCAVAACGDGHVKAGAEVCDDGNMNDWDGCGSSCEPSKFWVFVTSKTFNGAMGGLEGADLKCNMAAMTGQLAGPIKYKAWLSDNNLAAAARIEHGLGSYRRPDGVTVAASWEELTSGSLKAPITVTELLGNAPMANNPQCGSKSLAYTNTSKNGGQFKPDRDCLNWTQTVGPAAFGDPSAIDGTWTEFCDQMEMATCATFAAIYCVQEPS